jgi:hypothetical protein
LNYTYVVLITCGFFTIVLSYLQMTSFQFPRCCDEVYLSLYLQHDFLRLIGRVDYHNEQAILAFIYKDGTSHIIAPTFCGEVGCRSANHTIIRFECSTGVPT